MAAAACATTFRNVRRSTPFRNVEDESVEVELMTSLCTMRPPALGRRRNDLVPWICRQLVCTLAGGWNRLEGAKEKSVSAVRTFTRVVPDPLSTGPPYRKRWSISNNCSLPVISLRIESLSSNLAFCPGFALCAITQRNAEFFIILCHSPQVPSFHACTRPTKSSFFFLLVFSHRSCLISPHPHLCAASRPMAPGSVNLAWYLSCSPAEDRLWPLP